jgi:hypothetical protein
LLLVVGHSGPVGSSVGPRLEKPKLQTTAVVAQVASDLPCKLSIGRLSGMGSDNLWVTGNLFCIDYMAMAE